MVGVEVWFDLVMAVQAGPFVCTKSPGRVILGKAPGDQAVADSNGR